MNSEWGPETSEPMIKEVRDFLIPFGGTLGDLIDATPRDNISRVFLEDKMFETWHHGRTVLIGDGTLIQSFLCLGDRAALIWFLALTHEHFHIPPILFFLTF